MSKMMTALLLLLSVCLSLPLSPPPTLIFPGGGIYFYHMVGQLLYLRSSPKKYIPLSSCPTVGASAGALVATMCRCDTDFVQATKCAVGMVEDCGLWSRRRGDDDYDDDYDYDYDDETNNAAATPTSKQKKFGLMGIWGEMVSSWLSINLPPSAHNISTSSVTILLTPLSLSPSKKVSVNVFHTREELINANLYSVHIPFFLDGKPWRKWRGMRVVDGSFRLKTAEDVVTAVEKSRRLGDDGSRKGLCHDDGIVPDKIEKWIGFDYKDDPVMYPNNIDGDGSNKKKGKLDFVSLTDSEDGIWDMIRRGGEFAKIREQRGDFKMLEM